MKLFFCSIILLFVFFNTKAQEYESPIDSYRNNVVLHTSLSWRDAPFNLQGEFGQVDKLQYRSNLNLVHGVGIAYKWFALNINYKLPSYFRNPNHYGKTRYFDVGFQFSVKERWYFRVDFRDYNGYSIKGASKISPMLETTSKDLHVNSDLRYLTLSLNGYFMLKKNINMKAALGIVGRYNQAAHGFYWKFFLNTYAISRREGFLPYHLFNNSNALFEASNISAIEIGGAPGYAYVNNINGWQFGTFAGLSGALQVKSYQRKGETTGSIGFAPYIDFRLQGGYNVDRWFLMLTTNFDYKYINFKELSYSQFYYNIQLTYGYRFKEKEKKEKKKKNKR